MDNNEHIFPWGKSLNSYSLTNTSKHIPLFPEFKPEVPPMFEVTIGNREEVPAEFLTYALERFFHFSPEQAGQTLEASLEDEIRVGSYTRDVAETKAIEIEDFAYRNHHSLKCAIQEQKNAIKKS